MIKVDLIDLILKIEELSAYIGVNRSCRVRCKWKILMFMLNSFPVDTCQPRRIFNLLEIADSVLWIRMKQVREQLLKIWILCSF